MKPRITKCKRRPPQVVKDTFQIVCLSSKRLKELVDREEYEKAESEIENLDRAIRQIGLEQISKLDDAQLSYLKRLADWLCDKEGRMGERSTQLVSAITPLNSNSAFRQKKKY